MRVSDDRYTRDPPQFDLALRLIRHEARTTPSANGPDLTDDRIRKLYRSYFVKARRASGVCCATAASRRARRLFSSATPNSISTPRSWRACSDLRTDARQRPRRRAALSSRLAGVRRTCCVSAYETYIDMHSRPASPSSTLGFCCWRSRATRRSASPRCALCGGLRRARFVGEA